MWHDFAFIPIEVYNKAKAWVMYRKHLLYFGIVAIKFFFNLDNDLSHQVFFILLMAIVFIKVSFTEISYHCNVLMTKQVNTIMRLTQSIKQGKNPGNFCWNFENK